MSKSDDEGKKMEEFFRKNFPAGEYAVVSVMVRLDEMEKFVEAMKKSGLNLAIMPKVQNELNFQNLKKNKNSKKN